MAQSYLQRVADELADLALADQAASGDIGIVDAIGDVLGASSQTLQETYLTSIRVRRAEARARDLLTQRKANNYAEAPKPKAAPLQGVKEEPAEEAPKEPLQIEDASSKDPTAPIGNAPRRVTR